MAEADVPVAQLNFTADEINERLAAVPDKADASALTNKQDTLVSGVNIKPVNGESLLGEGYLQVQDTLVSGSNIKTVNGESLLGEGNLQVQDTLVSGSNIKTVNGASLLGEGDIEIQSGLISGVNIKTVNGESLLGEGDIAIQAGGQDNFSAATTAQGSVTSVSGVSSGYIYCTKYAGWVQCRVAVTFSAALSSSKILGYVPADYRPDLSSSDPTRMVALACSNPALAAGWYYNGGISITSSGTGTVYLSGTWPAAS